MADVVTGRSTWLLLIVFAMAPDLALLAGAGPGLERGQIHPRAVPFYNAVHRFWAPAVLVAVSLLLTPAWLAAGLAWIAHICVRSEPGFRASQSRGIPARLKLWP